MRTALLFLALALTAPCRAEERPVAPYEMSDANAGATPLPDAAVFEAMHGRDGVQRIVDDLVARSVADPRIAGIFVNQDLERLRRTLGEQICYIAGGPCRYSGRTMAAAHADMGIRTYDFNALVEHLRDAMDREGVPFALQNRLVAKLAPMRREIVAR
jgi:hemoglobin